MPIVSKKERSDFLEQEYPVLYRLCVADRLPKLLTYRFSTELQFCYGNTEAGSLIPSDWDSDGVRVVPLWESTSVLTAIRETATGREFVQISFEDPNDVEILAHSTEGLFTYLFYFMIESLDETDKETSDEIKHLAARLGFQRLPATIEMVTQLSEEEDYEELFKVTRSI